MRLVIWFCQCVCLSAQVTSFVSSANAAPPPTNATSDEQCPWDALLRDERYDEAVLRFGVRSGQLQAAMLRQIAEARRSNDVKRTLRLYRDYFHHFPFGAWNWKRDAPAWCDAARAYVTLRAANGQPTDVEPLEAFDRLTEAYRGHLGGRCEPLADEFAEKFPHSPFYVAAVLCAAQLAETRQAAAGPLFERHLARLNEVQAPARCRVLLLLAYVHHAPPEFDRTEALHREIERLSRITFERQISQHVVFRCLTERLVSGTARKRQGEPNAEWAEWADRMKGFQVTLPKGQMARWAELAADAEASVRAGIRDVYELLASFHQQRGEWEQAAGFWHAWTPNSGCTNCLASMRQAKIMGLAECRLRLGRTDAPIEDALRLVVRWNDLAVATPEMVRFLWDIYREAGQTDDLLRMLSEFETWLAKEFAHDRQLHSAILERLSSRHLRTFQGIERCVQQRRFDELWKSLADHVNDEVSLQVVGEAIARCSDDIVPALLAASRPAPPNHEAPVPLRNVAYCLARHPSATARDVVKRWLQTYDRPQEHEQIVRGLLMQGETGRRVLASFLQDGLFRGIDEFVLAQLANPPSNPSRPFGIPRGSLPKKLPDPPTRHQPPDDDR